MIQFGAQSLDKKHSEPLPKYVIYLLFLLKKCFCILFAMWKHCSKYWEFRREHIGQGPCLHGLLGKTETDK